MKVLLATPYRLDPEMGGPAHTVATIGTKLSELGVETSFLMGDSRRFPPPGPRARLRDVGNVDLVHTFGIWSPFNHAVSVGARWSAVPSVVGPLGMLEPWALAQSARKKRLALQLYQQRDLARASAVHATAIAEAESVRSIGVKSPIALIPHGFDAPSDIAISVKEEEGRQLKTLLFLSRIHPKKGLLDLVEAWAELRPPDWRVVVAGPDEGGHRNEVEAAVRRYRLENNFVFLGPVAQEEKHRLLKSADLFVLPTYSENFGLVVPEALAHGTPVLTTQGTPWSELVETKSGWWIATGAAALTDALQHVLPLSVAELRAMGSNGRRMVLERYSWSAIIAKHIDLYRWLTGSGPKPSFVLD